MSQASPARLDLADFVPGGVRRTTTLWEVATPLRLLSDTHIGSATSTPRHAAGSDLDRLLDRDPSGAPRLRATTLAGLLRHALAARLGPGPEGKEHPAVAELFGKAEPRENVEEEAEGPPTMSVLDLDDAAGELPEHHEVAVRFGNRVDPDSGVVAPGLLWQMEVLPAGTTFLVTLRLHLTDQHDEGRLLALLALAADSLTGPEDGPGIRLGARTGRGLGAVRAETWHARRHDILTPDGWAGFFAHTWRGRWARASEAVTGQRAPERAASLRARLTTALAAGGPALEDTKRAFSTVLGELGTDRRTRDELRLTVAIGELPTAAFLAEDSPPAEGEPDLRPGSIRIGDTPEPDALEEVNRAHRHRPHLRGDGTVEHQPMLGDTALFSLFKRIGRRLARDVSGHHEWPRGTSTDIWHTTWWGGEQPGTGDPVPARIRLRAVPAIDGGEALRTTRTTVDALFGDTVDTRLFTDDTHTGGSAELTLDVREPDDAIRGLLTLIVRELATVPLDTIGGGEGVGNGRLVATRAELVRHEPGAEPRSYDLRAALSDPHHPQRAELAGWLAALRRQVAPRETRQEETV